MRKRHRLSIHEPSVDNRAICGGILNKWIRAIDEGDHNMPFGYTAHVDYDVASRVAADCC
jgi:hypothetical protein